MNDDVPEGWVKTTLAHVISEMKTGPFGSALHKSDYVIDGIPVINPVNIGRDRIEPSAEVSIGTGTFSKLQEYALRNGDVIIARRGEMGRCAVVRESEAGWLCGTGSAVLRASDAALPSFLQKLISSPAVRSYLSDASVGTTMDNLNQQMFREMEVLLPPISEQRRIVAKLEELLNKVDACQRRLKKIPGLIKRFRQGVLAAACEGRLTEDWREQNDAEEAAVIIERIRAKRPAPYQNASVRDDLELPGVPETWSWTNLRFLLSPAEAFCYGVVQPGVDAPGGALLVRAGDLVGGRVDTSALRHIPLAVHSEYMRSQLAGGEILVTVVGAGIGETAIAQPECAGFNIARAVAKLPVREFEARYVHFWLCTSIAVGWMKGDSREVARPTLNLEQLKTLPVPVPSLAEQQEVVRRIEALFALADHLESRYHRAVSLVDKLTPALLAKAFRGELVPQDPDDEPAGVMLERIRTEREKAQPAERQKRGRAHREVRTNQ